MKTTVKELQEVPLFVLLCKDILQKRKIRSERKWKY